jgi:hypothetical protein
MTVVPKNARDKVLQAALVRTEPVTLPPSVTVPPGQLGAGSLPGTVTGSNGTTLVNVGNFQAQTVVADQVDTRGLTIKDAGGNIIFSAGVPLSAGRVSGLGALASQDVVDLASQYVKGSINGATQVTNLGSLAYANVVAAEQVVAGSFVGKTFKGGTFEGTTFSGVNMITENLRVHSVNATDELKAFNVTATGTSTILNLVVGKDIFAPNAVINTLNLAATNDVRTVNLYVTGATSFQNIYAANDVNGLHLYARSSLNVAGPSTLAGVSCGSINSGAINTQGANITGGSITSSWDLKCEHLYAFGSVSGAGFNNFLRKGSHSAIFNDGGGDRAVTITFN